MDLIIGIIGSIIGNFLTDLTKSVMNWNNLFGPNKLEPSQVRIPPEISVVDQNKFARRTLNKARVESIKWAFLMVTWTLLVLFVAALLPLLLNGNLRMSVDFQTSRIPWFPIESASAISVSLVFVAVFFIPVFVIGQIITKLIEGIYDREWGDVTPQKYFLFYIRSILPLIIVYSSVVIFLFYPNIDYWESLKYPLYFVGGVFVLAIAGYGS